MLHQPLLINFQYEWVESKSFLTEKTEEAFFFPLCEDSLFSLTAPYTITWPYLSQKRGPGPCHQHRWRNPEKAVVLISPYLPHPSFEAHAHPRPHLSYTLMVLCQLSFTLSGFADSFIKECNWSLSFVTSRLLESTFLYYQFKFWLLCILISLKDKLVDGWGQD